MRRTEFSTAAFVIAFVLARNAEEAFRQAMLLSDDGILIFVKEPVALAFLVVGVAVLIFRSVSVIRHSQKVAALSTSIFWLVLPSLVLFVVLPPLLLRVKLSFALSLALSTAAMLASYGLMLLVLRGFGVKL